MGDKKKERYYTTQPKYVTRVVARQMKREIGGWGFEVRDGHGALVAWSTVIYRTPEEASQQARERFGPRGVCERIGQQAINEKWTPGLLVTVLDKVLRNEFVRGEGR